MAAIPRSDETPRTGNTAATRAGHDERVADLFDDYRRGPAWDEVFDWDGSPHRQCQALHDALRQLTPSDVDGRCANLDRSFRDQGVTFSLSGEERPFPLDLVPRVIPAAEWATIEAGVAQRVLALEAFLADVYGPAEILADGLVPRGVVVTSAHFHRAAAGIQPPNGVRVHVSGVDLVRDVDGRFRVLEDNLRTPSGVSYVIENRRAMSRVFPELFESHRVRPVESYPMVLRDSLAAAAPRPRGEPTIVVLTPGVHNSAYFEHSFLARQMGVELVEGSDLTVRDQVVYLRTTAGERRVDVIYRRVDDDFLDPIHFRADSVVGCPGLLNAARAGNVALANAVGNGVADDKLIYTYVPDMIRYYLGEDPILPNVPTYRLDDPDQRADVLARLDQLVLKPVDASGGYGIVMGPSASDEQLAAVADAVRARPRAWIAQELVQLSTAPTRVGDRLAPRHVDLRPFALNDGERVWVAPGGLTRVALGEGNFIVNSSQGGGSKDTWVLADGEGEREGAGPAARLLPSRAHAGLPPDPGPVLAELGSQQQQQQQQGPAVGATGRAPC